MKLGLKFVSQRSMQLGIFEFLKQVTSVFNGEKTKVSKKLITRSNIEISHKN